MLAQLENYRKKSKKAKSKTSADNGPALLLEVSPDDESILQVNKRGKLTVISLSEKSSTESWTVWSMENAH